MAPSRRTYYQTLMMEDITDIITNLLTVHPKIIHVEIGIKNLYTQNFPQLIHLTLWPPVKK
jgi:hypothetical protein